MGTGEKFFWSTNDDPQLITRFETKSKMRNETLNSSATFGSRKIAPMARASICRTSPRIDVSRAKVKRLIYEKWG